MIKFLDEIITATLLYDKIPQDHKLLHEKIKYHKIKIYVMIDYKL